MTQYQEFKQEQCVLVTGASSGLGQSIALAYAKQGCSLILLARRQDRLKVVKQACLKEGASKVLTHPIDFLDKASIDSAFEWLQQRPLPHIWVNNIGYGEFKAVKDLTYQGIADLLQVNLTATSYFASRAVQAVLIERQKLPAKGFHFFFVASQAGKMATSKAAVYAASKAGLIAFANALRLELRAQQIMVTTVNPGPMATPFFNRADPGGHYYQKIQRYLLSVEKVAQGIVLATGKSKRELNYPLSMAVMAKLYALLPRMGDWITHRWFDFKV